MNTNRIYILFTLALIIVLSLHACSRKSIAKLEEPVLLPQMEYVKHYAYSYQYNESAEQASWVAYHLKASELQANYKRTNNFKVDTLISTGTATNKDYKGSGFDKGHLLPQIWYGANKL